MSVYSKQYVERLGEQEKDAESKKIEVEKILYRISTLYLSQRRRVVEVAYLVEW